MTAEEWIEKLGLQPHPEGGFYKQTHGSGWQVDLPERRGSRRAGLTTIFYMLTADSPIGLLHRNRSDIVHFFHVGAPLTYILVSPEGELSQCVLGPDPNRGHVLQMVVPGGWWKATHLTDGPFALVGESVAPGFDYRDWDLAREALIRPWLPELWDRLAPYVPGDR